MRDDLMTIHTVGVAGDGPQALAIVGQLGRRDGYRIVLHGIEGPEVAAFALRKGRIETAANLFDLASECEVVITAYASHADLRAALTGWEDRPGLLRAMAPGALIVDFSAGSPSDCRRLAGQLAGRAIGLVEAAWDAPTRRVLLGGFGEHIDQVSAVLSTLDRVVRVGPQGSARLLVALTASVEAATVIANSEAAAIAAAHGIVWDDGDEPERSSQERAELLAHLARSLEAAEACDVPVPLITGLVALVDPTRDVTPPSSSDSLPAD
jgi:3-hydroxyisobutyrate dehydrogenase-like beta-hydroxyacid dehydrogenase